MKKKKKERSSRRKILVRCFSILFISPPSFIPGCWTFPSTKNSVDVMTFLFLSILGVEDRLLLFPQYRNVHTTELKKTNSFDEFSAWYVCCVCERKEEKIKPFSTFRWSGMQQQQQHVFLANEAAAAAEKLQFLTFQAFVFFSVRRYFS